MTLPTEYADLLEVRGARSQWFPPVLSDLARLLELVEEVRPLSILEHGTGWSTVILWHWAKKNGAVVESLENDPLFYIAAKNGLDRPDADRRVLFSPVQNTDRLGVLCWSYQTLYAPEFIYVDGPALPANHVALPFCDTRKLKLMVFDGREANARCVASGSGLVLDDSEAPDRFMLRRK